MFSATALATTATATATTAVAAITAGGGMERRMSRGQIVSYGLGLQERLSVRPPCSNPWHAHIHKASQSCLTHSLRCVGA
jgi:hypothetical protein